MGFGDVTLMMMVGAFLGWQAGVVIFFLAPFAGLVVGVLQLVLRRDDEIPYGPFLCLAHARGHRAVGRPLECRFADCRPSSNSPGW